MTPPHLFHAALTLPNPSQEKAAQDLAETERRRAVLEREQEALGKESAEAKALAQALSREKDVLDNARKCLQDEAKDVEARRARLEEFQETGQAGLEEGRGELRVAAERLEAEKEKLKASRQVNRQVADEKVRVGVWGKG